MPLSNIYENFLFLVAISSCGLRCFFLLEYELDVVANIHRLAYKVRHYENSGTERLSGCPSLLFRFDIGGVHHW